MISSYFFVFSGLNCSQSVIFAVVNIDIEIYISTSTSCNFRFENRKNHMGANLLNMVVDGLLRFKLYYWKSMGWCFIVLQELDDVFTKRFNIRKIRKDYLLNFKRLWLFFDLCGSTIPKIDELQQVRILILPPVIMHLPSVFLIEIKCFINRFVICS